jgi:DNA-binding NarL/FixJ family response regulator
MTKSQITERRAIVRQMVERGEKNIVIAYELGVSLDAAKKIKRRLLRGRV